MDRRITGIVFCALLWVSGGVQGQNEKSSSHRPDTASDSSHGLESLHTPVIPVTPQQEARMRRLGELGEAAAAALDDEQYAEAEADAREALSIRMDYGIAQEVLASSLNAQGKTQQALKAYATIASEGDTLPRNLLPYALLLLKTGHWAQAVAAYDKQLPFLAEGGLMVANSHFSSAVPQPRQLATALHIALGLTDETATWGGHMQDDKALAEFRWAETLTPDSALAYLYYGRQLQHMGHRAQAQVAYTKAVALGRGDVKAAAETAFRQPQWSGRPPRKP
jgi:tetratricopeptide (TPR) repeat protein